MTIEPINWQGDLHDDCSAFWSGLLLRAEEMERGLWWWAVSNAATGELIADSLRSDIRATTGAKARAAAEVAARLWCEERKRSRTNPSFRDVIALVEAAFADVRRDEDCTLHQAQLADQSMSREIPHEEWDAEKLRDPETDWRDVPGASIDECSAALSHATPQSWLFYLPAYMRRALELWDVDTLESDLRNSVIFHLTQDSKDMGLAAYVLERFIQMNRQQEAAVVAFLEYFRDVADEWHSRCASEALASYWALPPEKRERSLIIIP